MKTARQSKIRRRSRLETLEDRINLTAAIAGIDVGGAGWTSDFFPGQVQWLPIKEGLQEDHAIGYAGFDKLRFRFTEPVTAKVDTGAIALIYQDGVLPGTIGENIQIANDGLSAVWQLPEVAADQLFAIRAKDGAFEDADDGADVSGLLFELSVLPGDSDGDRAVSFADFLSLSANFGQSGAGLADDFLPNGRVEFADFLLLSANFSKDLGGGKFTESQLVSGETIVSTLNLGDVNIFTLDAEAGERLFLSLSESVRTSAFSLDLDMYSPSGELVISSEATFNGTTFDKVKLPETGTYSILVRENGNDTAGDYVLTAVVLDEQIDVDNEALQSGEGVQRSLDAADIDTFTFSATEGEELFLTLAESVGASSFNPGVFIYAPDGSLIDEAATVFNGTDFSDLALPQSGTYTVVVRDDTGDSVGDYWLTAVIVDDQIDFDNSVLNSGETVVEELTEGDIDTYTFDAMANDTLFLTVSEQVRSSSFNPGVFIYGPSGTLVESDGSIFNGFAISELVLPESGTYTIVVRDASADSTGQYSVSAVVVDERKNAGSVTLNSGETYEGDLAFGEIDTLTIDAQANEKLFLSISEMVRSSSFNPGIFVYAPDGTLVISQNAVFNGQSFSDFVVPLTGTYTVVIRDDSGDSAGDYSITAVVVDETVDADNMMLTSGESVSGMLDSGDIDTFTFTAEADKRFFLTFSEAVAPSSFNPGVFIYAPDGTLWNSINSTVNGHTFSDLPLAQPGTYTVVVRDMTADQVGEYTMTAIIVDEQVDVDNEILIREETKPGTLSLGDIDTFTIVANNNEKLLITLTESVASSGFNPGIFVYGPDRKLISSIPSSVSGAMLTDIPPTQAGTYTIVIRDASGDVSGDYSILVNSLPS